MLKNPVPQTPLWHSSGPHQSFQSCEKAFLEILISYHILWSNVVGSFQLITIFIPGLIKLNQQIKSNHKNQWNQIICFPRSHQIKPGNFLQATKIMTFTASTWHKYSWSINQIYLWQIFKYPAEPNIHQIFKHPPQANIHQIIKYIWQILSKYWNIHLSQQNILLTMSSQ